MDPECVIDLFEERVADIEEKLYGSQRVPPASSPPIIDTVLSATTLLNAAANGHDNISAIYKRQHELTRYLSEATSGYNGLVAAETERQLNTLMALQKEHSGTLERLKAIKDLETYLDTSHLTEMEELTPLLSDAVDRFSSLQTDLGNGIKAPQVLLYWQSMVTEVSKSFIAANAKLMEMENKALALKKKNSLDD